MRKFILFFGFAALAMGCTLFEKDRVIIKHSNSDRIGKFHNLPDKVKSEIRKFYDSIPERHKPETIINLTSNKVSHKIHTLGESLEVYKYQGAFFEINIGEKRFMMKEIPYWPVVIYNKDIYYINLKHRSKNTLMDTVYQDFIYFKYEF